MFLHKVRRPLYVLLVCLFSLLLPWLLIAASPSPLQDTPPAELPTLLTGFLSLLGFAGLAAVLINAGKHFGIVKDGQAPTYSLIFNVVGFVVFVALKLFAPSVDVAGVDSTLSQVAEILVLVLGLVGQLSGSKLAAQGLRGLPVIGKSHSKPTNSPAQLA